MRIYLRLSQNKKKVIPFNYQELLTGTVHKWLGANNASHGKPNQISFSWIQNTYSTKDGLNLKSNAYFFIGAFQDALIKQIVKGVLDDPTMFCGVKAQEVQIVDTPEFRPTETFLMASPVLLKLKTETGTKHVTLEDAEFEEVLNQSFKNKLKRAKLPTDGVLLKLDPDSHYRKTKMIRYKGIENKALLTPIFIKGNSEQIGFAWSAGLGNSTGAGFGTLK